MSDSQLEARRSPEGLLYVGLSLLIASIAVAGFAPLGIRQLLNHDLPKDAVIHVHAAVYVIWLGLFFAQTVCAAMDKMIFHRRMGKFLVGYGVLMYVVGLAVTLNRFIKNVHSGDIALAEQINFAPFTDMIAFPLLFGAAIYFVKQPEVHKRLMVVACTVLLYAAMVRIEFAPISNHYSLFILVWSSPLLVGIANDWIRRRSLHPAYSVGMLVLFVLSLRPHFSHSHLWITISGWLASMV
ncbi:MAG: hypothetical protein QM808_06555 [Steroidobacteraceae bacterium]